MKAKCPDCAEDVEVDKNEVDENDCLECPECFAHLIVKIKAGRIRLVTEKEKYFDESLNEFYDEEE